MADRLRVSRVRFSPAPDAATADGLLGWISCVVDDAIRLDGLRVRRTRDGQSVLSWPCRRDRAGREHAIVAPLDEHARQHLEGQVFRALRLGRGGRL